MIRTYDFVKLMDLRRGLVIFVGYTAREKGEGRRDKGEERREKGQGGSITK